MSPAHVEVDQNVCQSAGYCIRTAPTVFAADADGIVALRDGDHLTAGPIEIPEDRTELVDRAAWDCPAAAITIS
ncbi:ferredoxin [Nocardia arthritidis]|uniref:Ferredoxin n=1 Tax=Nocardia arthritidis TaxID=228602 RepID=A0A6G9YNN5_9NOCA|nr:ferredoxin [Nocardia arthritidis]QIS14915.1 ferredoxin [Nocardia arthritidis]